jgi:prophage regulatory protein
MNQQARHAIPNPLLRLETVLALTGESRSSYYDKAAKGLAPKPIKIGLRASAVPAQEIEAVNAARIAGKSHAEIRELVQRLEAARARAAEGV